MVRWHKKLIQVISRCMNISSTTRTPFTTWSWTWLVTGWSSRRLNRDQNRLLVVLVWRAKQTNKAAVYGTHIYHVFLMSAPLGSSCCWILYVMFSIQQYTICYTEYCTLWRRFFVGAGFSNTYSHWAKISKLIVSQAITHTIWYSHGVCFGILIRFITQLPCWYLLLAALFILQPASKTKQRSICLE